MTSHPQSITRNTKKKKAAAKLTAEKVVKEEKKASKHLQKAENVMKREVAKGKREDSLERALKNGCNRRLPSRNQFLCSTIRQHQH